MKDNLFFNSQYHHEEDNQDIEPLIGHIMDLDQILFKQHPLINKRAKWKLGDIFNFEKLEPPTYLTLLCKSYFFNVSYLSLYFIFFIIFFIICR